MDNVSWFNGLGVWDELNIKSIRSWVQKIMIGHNLMVQTFIKKTFFRGGSNIH